MLKDFCRFVKIRIATFLELQADIASRTKEPMIAFSLFSCRLDLPYNLKRVLHFSNVRAILTKEKQRENCLLCRT